MGALAQLMANQADEDVLQALQLFDSLRPHLREQMLSFREPLKRYTGHLGHVNQQKGYGFISSPDAMEDFGKDVFVSMNELGKIKSGDQVTFTVITNKDQKPQARLLEGSDGAIPVFMEFFSGSSPPPQAPPPVHYQVHYPPPAPHPAYPPAGPPPPAYPPHPPPPSYQPSWEAPPSKKPRVVLPERHHQSQQSDPTQGKYVGTITTFNDQTHFGFISSQQATQNFGKDVFLSSMEIGQFRVGDTVSFDVALNKSGKPQARNLSAGHAAPPAPPPPVSTSHHSPRQSTGPPPGEGDMTRYCGTIQTFNPDKHFGFISCPEVAHQYSKDTFVSDLELGNYRVGDQISFRVVLNSRGHPQARDLGPPEDADAPGFGSASNGLLS